MHLNNIFRPSVGADLSCTPPIYRPSVGVPLSGLYCETASSVQSDRFYYPDLKVKKHHLTPTNHIVEKINQ